MLANSVDPDAAFHLGLHCFTKYPFRGLRSRMEPVKSHFAHKVYIARTSSERNGQLSGQIILRRKSLVSTDTVCNNFVRQSKY